VDPGHSPQMRPIHAKTMEADIHPGLAGTLPLHRRKPASSPMRPDHNRGRRSCSKVIALPDPTAAQRSKRSFVVGAARSQEPFTALRTRSTSGLDTLSGNRFAYVFHVSS